MNTKYETNYAYIACRCASLLTCNYHHVFIILLVRRCQLTVCSPPLKSDPQAYVMFKHPIIHVSVGCCFAEGWDGWEGCEGLEGHESAATDGTLTTSGGTVAVS